MLNQRGECDQLKLFLLKYSLIKRIDTSDFKWFLKATITSINLWRFVLDEACANWTVHGKLRMIKVSWANPAINMDDWNGTSLSGGTSLGPSTWPMYMLQVHAEQHFWWWYWCRFAWTFEAPQASWKWGHLLCWSTSQFVCWMWFTSATNTIRCYVYLLHM